MWTCFISTQWESLSYVSLFTVLLAPPPLLSLSPSLVKWSCFVTVITIKASQLQLFRLKQKMDREKTPKCQKFRPKYLRYFLFLLFKNAPNLNLATVARMLEALLLMGGKLVLARALAASLLIQLHPNKHSRTGFDPSWLSERKYSLLYKTGTGKARCKSK